MDRIAQFLGPFRTLEPARWVAFADQIPRYASIAMIIAGAAVALFASNQMFRFVAGPLGAIAGILAGPTIATLLHVKAATASWVTGVVLGAAGGIYPPILVFGVCGGVGGLAGSLLTGDEDYWLGFLPGFIICGGAAMFAIRTVEAAVSGVVGGALMIWGLMRLFGLTGTLVGFPSLALGAVGVAGLASIVFQLKVRRTPEEAQIAKAKRADEKRRKREDIERAERFASYSRKGREAKDEE